jgi:hypothetical protein
MQGRLKTLGISLLFPIAFDLNSERLLNRRKICKDKIEKCYPYKQMIPFEYDMRIENGRLIFKLSHPLNIPKEIKSIAIYYKDKPKKQLWYLGISGSIFNAKEFHYGQKDINDAVVEIKPAPLEANIEYILYVTDSNFRLQPYDELVFKLNQKIIPPK